MDKLDRIASMVSRYARIEDTYSRNNVSLLNADVEAAIVKLYSKILHFEAVAALHFGNNTAVRAARNVIKLDDWEAIFSKISSLDDSCMKAIGVANYVETEAELDQIYALLERSNGRSLSRVLN